MFTKGSYNFTRAYYKKFGARCNFPVAYFIKIGAYYSVLVVACKFYVANKLVLGASCTEN